MSSSEPPSLVPVRLLGTPIELHRITAEHYDAARRELSLMVADDGNREMLADLPQVMEDMSEQYNILAPTTEELKAAVKVGDQRVDLVFQVPPGFDDDCRRFTVVLERVDALCREGRYLLTLADTRVELYRRWLIGQFIDQLTGEQPTSWADSPEAVELAQAAPTEASVVGAHMTVAGDRVSATLSVAHRSPTSVTLRLSGEVDLDQAPSLRRLFADLLADGVQEITVDGANVEFIDSVGVSVLMAMLSRCSEAGGSMSVLAPSPSLLATLQLAGVADMLIAT